MDIKLPIELQTIDLGAALPWLVLLVLAALIIGALIALRLIKSRAFGLAIIAVIIVLGSTTIVGGLQAVTGLIAVVGIMFVIGVVALGRNPDVLEVVREVVNKPAMPPAGWSQMIEQPRQTKQIAAPRQPTEQMPRIKADSDRWGFS